MTYDWMGELMELSLANDEFRQARDEIRMMFIPAFARARVWEPRPMPKGWTPFQ